MAGRPLLDETPEAENNKGNETYQDIEDLAAWLRDWICDPEVEIAWVCLDEDFNQLPAPQKEDD